MKNRAMKELTRWSLGLLLMMPALAVAADDIDSTQKMPGDGLVRVENLAGGVEFTTWDRDEVQVRGRVADDVEEVKIETTANGIRVEVRNKRNRRQVDPTYLHLKIPSGASIEAESVSADLSVSGSRGESVTLDTVSGDVEVEAMSTRIDIASVSGDVEFEGAAERISAESVSGDVVLIGVRTEVEASTVSGDVTLEGGIINNGRFETVSGEINLVLELADGGRLDCDAMSGDISLRLPADQQAAFTAQSYSGEINSEFGDPRRNSDSPSGQILKAKAGDNGARIRLETFSGDISIRAR
jgi:DUF4097 and DUF4098 domain-containing protein YvlB